MRLKLEELVDMFDEIQNYEYIAYDKKENNFIFIDLNMMPMQEYEELTDKIEERYYYLPSSYVFHDSELIEEYIDEIENENIQEELEDAFYGKGKYRSFKETLRKFRIGNDYYNFREEYLKDMAIEWCKKIISNMKYKNLYL